MATCTCSEGRFERTINNFAGRDARAMDPHAQTFIHAKPGTVCAAPPVHDCTYIRVRNQLSMEAMQTAYAETRDIKDVHTRDAAIIRIYQTEIRRLVAEYYATH